MAKFRTFYNLHSLQKRFIAIVLIVVTLFVVLLGRIFYLQMIKGKHLQMLAAEEWLRDLPLSSKRGEIYDSSGVSIATTITTYDVYVRARNVTNPSELATAITNALDLEYSTAYNKVTNTSISEVLIKMQVEPSTALSLAEYDGVYLSNRKYLVTVIDKNPDSSFIDIVAKLPTCRFVRHYKSDNLNHYVFTLYF